MKSDPQRRRKPSHREKPAVKGWPLTRRGFLTSIGTGAAAVAASGTLLAATDGSENGPAPASAEPRAITLTVNGRPYPVLVEPRWTLLYVLRAKIGLTGAKEGCGRGECGACTVLIDGIARYACLTLAVEAQGTAVTTVEGLLDGESLGPVQEAFVAEDALQCGYCTPGHIMSVEALRRANASPSMAEIRTAVSGNLCRCGAYAHIFKAAAKAAGKSKR
jgi:xanthine dehydrogenase YagT iron-sulfur-binding subunit